MADDMTSPGTPPHRRRRRRLVTLIALGLFAALAGMFAWIYSHHELQVLRLRAWQLAVPKLYYRATGRIAGDHWIGYAGGQVAASRDGRMALASGSAGRGDLYGQIWSITAGRLERRLPLTGDFGLAFTPDGKWLVGNARLPDSGPYELAILSTGTGAAVHRLKHPAYVRSIAISEDGRLLATGGDDGKIRLFEIETGREVRILTGHTKAVWSVSFAPHGRTLVSAGDDKTFLWSVESGERLDVMDFEALRLAFLPDGRHVVGMTWAGPDKLAIWDVVGGKRVRALGEGHYAMKLMALSPDGRLLATDGRTYSTSPEVLATGDIHVWEVATGRRLASLSAHLDDVVSLSFAGDGKTLLSGGADGRMIVWNVSGL